MCEPDWWFANCASWRLLVGVLFFGLRGLGTTANGNRNIKTEVLWWETRFCPTFHLSPPPRNTVGKRDTTANELSSPAFPLSPPEPGALWEPFTACCSVTLRLPSQHLPGHEPWYLASYVCIKRGLGWVGAETKAQQPPVPPSHRGHRRSCLAA